MFLIPVNYQFKLIGNHFDNQLGLIIRISLFSLFYVTVNVMYLTFVLLVQTKQTSWICWALGTCDGYFFTCFLTFCGVNSWLIEKSIVDELIISSISNVSANPVFVCFSLFTSCSQSALRRLPCKNAANSTSDFRWRSVYYKLSPLVWRLPLQWTHCDAHPHLPIHQGVWVFKASVVCLLCFESFMGISHE